MTVPASAVHPLATTMADLGMSPDRLWVDYFGLGGRLMPSDLGDFLAGRTTIADIEYDRVVQALNEWFIERGDDHTLPYAEDLARG